MTSRDETKQAEHIATIEQLTNELKMAKEQDPITFNFVFIEPVCWHCRGRESGEESEGYLHVSRRLYLGLGWVFAIACYILLMIFEMLVLSFVLSQMIKVKEVKFTGFNRKTFERVLTQMYQVFDSLIVCPVKTEEGESVESPADQLKLSRSAAAMAFIPQHVYKVTLPFYFWWSIFVGKREENFGKPGKWEQEGNCVFKFWLHVTILWRCLINLAVVLLCGFCIAHSDTFEQLAFDLFWSSICTGIISLCPVAVAKSASTSFPPYCNAPGMYVGCASRCRKSLKLKDKERHHVFLHDLSGVNYAVSAALIFWCVHLTP